MTRWKKVFSIGASVGFIGSWWTLHSHDYDVNSLGFVRLARAGATVS